MQSRLRRALVSSVEVLQSMEVPLTRNLAPLSISNNHKVNLLSFFSARADLRSLPLEALSPKRASNSHTDSLPREHRRFHTAIALVDVG